MDVAALSVKKRAAYVAWAALQMWHGQRELRTRAGIRTNRRSPWTPA